jgi:hypothetical protein
MFGTVMVIMVLMLVGPQYGFAEDGEHIKWYGLGGELTGPKRWLGRIGISEYLGTEVIFGMEHISHDCPAGKTDCDSTKLDVGVGVIYDFVPAARISPYLAGRFILTMTGNGDSETSGTIEAASGVEYVIMKRIGLNGELNFSFHTDPTQVKTSTIVRFYFYF